jgi:hypothetical protein
MAILSECPSTCPYAHPQVYTVALDGHRFLARNSVGRYTYPRKVQAKRTRAISISATMGRWLSTLGALTLSVAGLASQSPVSIDTSKLGPQVGTVAPAFAGIDQFGKPHTLASSYGPNGAMLVFFRSADW